MRKMRKFLRIAIITIACCYMLTWWPRIPHYAADAIVYVARTVTSGIYAGTRTMVHAQSK